MENKLVQVQTNLQKSQPEDSNDKVSIYEKGKVSAKCFADCIVQIKKAFPKLTTGWFEILDEKLDLMEFNDKRLIDATNNLIINCPYPEPTIANILSFNVYKDRKTYEQICEETKNLPPESAKKVWNKYHLNKEDGYWYAE